MKRDKRKISYQSDHGWLMAIGARKAILSVGGMATFGTIDAVGGIDACVVNHTVDIAGNHQSSAIGRFRVIIEHDVCSRKPGIEKPLVP